MSSYHAGCADCTSLCAFAVSLLRGLARLHTATGPEPWRQKQPERERERASSVLVLPAEGLEAGSQRAKRSLFQKFNMQGLAKPDRCEVQQEDQAGQRLVALSRLGSFSCQGRAALQMLSLALAKGLRTFCSFHFAS